MLAAPCRFEPVAPQDFESLLALRIRAMRPSLERLGRFDPQRARERLRSTFAPEHMRHLVVDDGGPHGARRIGCVTLRPTADALHMDHLYLEPGAQRRGLGAWVMRWAKAEADTRGLMLKLQVLQGSDALRFYLRHGLHVVSEGEFDLDLARAPNTASPQHVVATLWQRFEARDWSGARTLLADAAVMHWWTSGERFDGGDAVIAVNERYPEGWSLRPQTMTRLDDGRVLSVVRVDHAPLQFFCTSIAAVEDGRIVEIDECWATTETPPVWRADGRLPGWSRFHAAPQGVGA